MGYRFALIVKNAVTSDEQIIELTESLGERGCTDASIRGHAEGVELLFERDADSLQSAITSAVADVEQVGLRVVRIEMERDSLAA